MAGDVCDCGFNPRPLLLTGESWKQTEICRVAMLFQSTPVIANGRIIARAYWPVLMSRFNPRPLLLTGESLNALAGRHRYSGFNPRPLLLTGESGVGRKVRVGLDVSIHARYC